MKILYTLLLALALTSCDSFLDIVPVGKLIPKTVEDYELMFNDDLSLKLLNSGTFFGAPNFGMGDQDFRSSEYYERSCYIWAKEIFDENSISYSDWGNIYAEIYIDNVVLEQIGSAEGDDNRRKEIIAEARVRRAFSYLLLMGIYAKQYDEATASSDLGVPLRLTADVSSNVPARSTVQEVYRFIETELLEAFDDVPDVADNKFRVDKAATNAILARLYLMMRKYDKAWTYADKALAANHFLYDYNTVEVVEDPWGDYIEQVEAEDNDENYLIRYYQYVYWGSNVSISAELFHLFPHDGSDVRENLGVLVEDEDNLLDSIYFSRADIMTIAPTVPEMYLIRAEGYARQGDAASLEKAMDDINYLRSFRTVPGTEELTATTADEVVEVVLAERRRELSLLGFLNWTDMKRLNKEEKYARTLTRTVDGKTYTLEPNSNNYVLPIPYDVMGYNSAIVNNPRD